MFREMRRSRQQVSIEACIDILKGTSRAALSVNGDEGYPYTVPINFLYDESRGSIFFHGSSQGAKAELLAKNDKVCFTCWGGDFKKEGAWEWNVTSVIVFGRCTVVNDEAVKMTALRGITFKYYPNAEEALKELSKTGSLERARVYEIIPEHISGKLVNEK